MNDKIKLTVLNEIKKYMKFMSKDAAVMKVKKNHLNRINFVIDEVAKTI